MSKLDKKEIKKIADLARLKISDKDLDSYTEDLSSVLGYVEKLNEVDTKNVKALGSASALDSVYRRDEQYSKELSQKTGYAEGLFKLAPFVKDGFVKVKSVFKK